MNDEVLVCVLDGCAHLPEQLEPCARVEQAIVAILDNPLPFHVLHGEDGSPSGVLPPSSKAAMQGC